MTDKDADRTRGLAEQSLNTSIVHPGLSTPDHQEQGDRIIAGNDQRKGLGKTDADRPQTR